MKREDLKSHKKHFHNKETNNMLKVEKLEINFHHTKRRQIKNFPFTINKRSKVIYLINYLKSKNINMDLRILKGGSIKNMEYQQRGFRISLINFIIIKILDKCKKMLLK